MSIEQREMEAYARERARTAAAAYETGGTDKRRLEIQIMDCMARGVCSSMVVQQIARLCGVLEPAYDTSEDAGKPWEQQDD